MAQRLGIGNVRRKFRDRYPTELNVVLFKQKFYINALMSYALPLSYDYFKLINYVFYNQVTVKDCT